MGYEQVFEGCMRSSVELRRVKNAKITAMRHRKWQEVRLQREMKEKKAAEEYLKRRRRERAQLAAYIYSSAQSMERESCVKSRSLQEHDSNVQATLARKRDDFDGVKNFMLPKSKAEEDVKLDVCRLPAISINDESSHTAFRKHHAGDVQKGTEATRDFLQEALQERLENETATTLLIAEITDMRSRLDDLLAKPLKGDDEGREKARLESKDAKVSCLLCEQKHEERTNSHFEGVTNDESINQATTGTEPCIYESLATEDQAIKRRSAWLHKEYAPPGILKANEVLPPQNIDSCVAAGACEDDTIIQRRQFQGDPEGCSFQLKSNGEKFFPTMGNVKDDGSIQLGLCCHDAHEDRCILRRMSQESCEQKTQRDVLEDDDNGGMLARCQPIKEHPVPNARGVVNKPTCMQATSDLLRTYKAAPIKQQCGSRESEDTISFCPKSRRDSTKLLDAEKSLLASLERLDVKLAMASANIQNSSRASLVSAGHQSTKSAPCVIRRKPGSDAYSVNSTMFLSRPMTSQAGGTSLFSKRRQNIGVTNVSKPKVNHLQTCNVQHMNRAPSLSKEERRPAAGTIIVHQNAEFLFN